MKSSPNLTTVEEIVADVLKQMSEIDKTTVIDTAEEDLIQFHNGWGMGIRTGTTFGTIQHW